jgi:hypothetical protein
MPKINDAFINNTVGRFAELSPDAQPKWGKLQGDQVVGHLIAAFRFTTGESPGMMPDVSNFFTRSIIGPLLLTGLIPIPKNVPLKDATGKRMDAPIAEGNVEDLRAAMTAFKEGLATGTLKTPNHPAFGDIGPEGWDKMHYLHTRHHMRQFGLA